MTQTIGATNIVNAVVHASADGVTWVDIGGSFNKLAKPMQAVDNGEDYSLDGQFPIITYGKMKAVEIALDVFYTEITNEAYDLLVTQFNKTGHPLWLRYSPKGAYNTFRYTCANGAGVAAPALMTSLEFPGADATDPKPHVVQIKVKTATLIRSSVTPSASLSPSASTSPSASVSPSASKSAGG